MVLMVVAALVVVAAIGGDNLTSHRAFFSSNLLEVAGSDR